jgi:hypothetical protein
MAAMGPAIAIRAALLFAVAYAEYACRIDAQWYGSFTASDPAIAVTIKTSFGPPAVSNEQDELSWTVPDTARLVGDNSTYYYVPYTAIDCLQTCLTSPDHNCTMTADQQCGWQGFEQAQASCDQWDDCNGFWCDATGLCRARKGTVIDRAAQWHTASSYVKAVESNSMAAQCASQACNWTWGIGEQDQGTIVLTTSSGANYNGVLAPNCSHIRWSGGGVWTNNNLKVKKVHVIFMTHFDVG